MIKIIFLDIDGTLINHQQEISPRTIEAIQQAKDKGYLLSICTGRAFNSIPDFIKALPFDGVIASAGAHGIWQGETLFRDQMSQEVLKHTLELLEAHHAYYVLDGQGGKYANPHSILQFKKMLSERGFENVDFQIQEVDNCQDIEGIESGMYYHADINVESMRQTVHERIQITPMSYTERDQFNGEFTQKGIHKASAIDKVIKHLGIQVEEVMAIGDGPNDKEMLMFAGTGIAMGNADQATQDIADYVTKNISEDGVYFAFKNFNIID